MRLWVLFSHIFVGVVSCDKLPAKPKQFHTTYLKLMIFQLLVGRYGCFPKGSALSVGFQFSFGQVCKSMEHCESQFSSPRVSSRVYFWTSK